jgi:hypothetical protein
MGAVSVDGPLVVRVWRGEAAGVAAPVHHTEFFEAVAL